MTKHHRQPLIAALLAACVAWTAAALADEYQQRPVAPGVVYIHEGHADGPLSIHVLRIDLSQKDLATVARLSNGTVLGRDTVSNIVAACPASLGKPIAAVNGDYFEMGNKGDPRYAGLLEGLHIAGGELIHGPIGNGFWFDAKGRPRLVEKVSQKFIVTWPDGSQRLFRINCSTTDYKSEVSAAEIVLYTPTFGPSTLTDSGLELALKPAPNSPWLPLRANKNYTAVVQSAEKKGNTAIAEGTMVLSVVSKVAESLAPIKAGDLIKLSVDIVPDLSDVAEATAGGPVLVTDGRPVATLDRNNKAPRTLIGYNATHLFLVVVDGRQPKLSMGFTHGQSADYMAKLGCSDALNLDGGGSTTMWLEGKVVNSPSDATGERPVGDALVLVQKTTAANGNR